MADPFQLGPFLLHRRLGRGGMSEVWEGSHVTQGVPVAVKVMTAEQTRQAEYRRAFGTEARAVAGLEHPGIVMVFDYGEIDEAVEHASGGRARAGSPYLAMELAAHGALTAVREAVGWPEQRLLLLSLLDALAHAHARGVIHRDMKPGNVLLAERVTSGAGLLGYRVKIADFGVAFAFENGQVPISVAAGEDDARDVYGTPSYMAPEQFWGRWRDYGPWTDTYALGVMAYRMATGHLPFRGEGLVQVARAHLEQPPPRMRPLRPVPEGLSAWVARLLAKSPADRFQRAADAALALIRLGEPEHTDHGVAIPMSPAELETTTLVFSEEDLASLGTPVRLQADGELCDRAVPKPAREWRRPWVRPSMQLVGAGLGLYGLRAVPLVDRDVERDTLWEALRAVRADGNARAVVLHGPAGCGKSRLVEWICERAHEAGCATTLRVTHGPLISAQEGLPATLAAHLRCEGLSEEGYIERLASFTKRHGGDEREWRALAELVRPVVTGTRVRFFSPTERYAVIRRFLWRIAREPSGLRPVALWLDDVQWGSDALAFVEFILASASVTPTPVLILLTACDADLTDRPLEAGLLEEIVGYPQVQNLRIGPLPAADHAQLVRQLLGLEGELASLVESRTAGNPMFAVQLVGDWVQRGLLEPGRGGFVVKEGADLDLPDEVHEVWRGRIARLVGPADGPALQIAAALGHAVDQGEWSTACAAARIVIPPGLVHRLLDARMIYATESGFSFAHGMLRESVVRSAKEEQRWAMVNKACASMLDRRPHDPARLGQHLVAAGELEAALAPLLEGARARVERCAFRAASALLGEREGVLAELDLPMSDRRWGAGWVLTARTLRLRNELEDAADYAERAEVGARLYSWEGELGESLFLQAEVLRLAGDLSSAEARYEDARAQFVAVGDSLGEANARLGLAEGCWMAGELTQAQELLRDVIGSFETIGDALGLAQALMTLGRVHRQRAELPEAIQCFEKALPYYEEIHHQGGLASCLMGVSSVLRLQGDDLLAGEDEARQARVLFQAIDDHVGVASVYNALAERARARGAMEQAEDGYRASLRIYEMVGHGEAFVPALNLGLVLLGRGRMAEARQVLDEARAELVIQNRSGWLGVVHALLLPTLVDDAMWSDHFRAMIHHLDRSGMVDPDIAWALSKAGELAAAEHPRRAREAWTLALEQYRALGDEAGGARAETALVLLADS